MARFARFKAKKDSAPKMGKAVRDAESAEMDGIVAKVKNTPGLVAKKLKGAKGKKKAKKAKKLNA